MPTYRNIGPDDKLEIKGGEKFHVLRKNDLLPDGRLQPKRDDQTEEEYDQYINDRLAEITGDREIPLPEMRKKLQKLWALPDSYKTRSWADRHKYEQEVRDLMNQELEIAEKERNDAKEALRQKIEEGKQLQLAVKAGSIELKLEANSVSRLHRLFEGQIYSLEKQDGMHYQDLSYAHVFVVRHDWLGVIGDTNPELDEWELPFAACIFEFRIGGHNVLVHVDVRTGKKEFSIFIEVERDVWFTACRPSGFLPIHDYAIRQVAACCVMLEAEVVTHELVRQPTALNAKRIKSNKKPLFDFHVLDLKRKRAAPNPNPGESGVRMRLHFVRGHWRQYPTHKTRIPWHLRGDPDLGFVDKMYRL